MIGELEREGRMKKKRERRGRVNLTLERVRFQTVTLNPWRRRLTAMALPMIPRPRNPTSILDSIVFLAARLYLTSPNQPEPPKYTPAALLLADSSKICDKNHVLWYRFVIAIAAIGWLTVGRGHHRGEADKARARCMVHLEQRDRGRPSKRSPRQPTNEGTNCQIVTKLWQ